MNIHRSTPITIARYGRSRNKTQDFEELSSIRSAEPSQSFSPNLGSPSPPETPNLSHCVSCIGKHLLLEPLEGDHVFRAVHVHSGEELVCKVKSPGLAFASCLFKTFPGGVEGGWMVREVAEPWSLGEGDSRDNSPWPRYIDIFIYFVPVRLAVKFLERCRQWGGLWRGRFGESRGRGGRRSRAGATDTRAPRISWSSSARGQVPLPRGFLPVSSPLPFQHGAGNPPLILRH